MNSIIPYAFEHFISLFQSGIFVTFCYKFLEPKFSKVLNIIAWAVTIVAMYIAITIQNYITPTFAFSEILIYSTIMIPYCILCLKGKLYQKISLPLLFYGFGLIISFIVSSISNEILGHYDTDLFGSPNFPLRVFYTVTVIMLQMFLLYILLKVYKNKIKLKNSIDIILYVALTFITLLVVCLCFSIASAPSTSSRHIIYLMFIMIAIFCIVVIVLNTMVKITRNHELKTQNIMMHKKQIIYQNEINNADKYISEVAKVKHDIKNKLFCIGEMLKSDNIDEAIKMCGNISNELKNTSDIFHTNNVFLNSILNVVSNKCDEAGIDTEFNIGCDFRNIEGTDLITIIGNLCDNAIESLSKQTDNKTLSLSLKKRGNYYILVVKNHIEASVLSDNPKLTTNKKNTMYHGYGIDNVKTLVHKYNGDIQFAEEDNMFIVRLMLEIPENFE